MTNGKVKHHVKKASKKKKRQAKNAGQPGRPVAFAGGRLRG